MFLLLLHIAMKVCPFFISIFIQKQIFGKALFDFLFNILKCLNPNLA